MGVLGIDVGTTGCKAILVHDDGTVAGSGYQEYGYEVRPDGRVEQNPEDWYQATAHAVRQATAGIDPSSVRALALSTQGGSSCLVDESMRPITPAITWMDTRSSREAEEMDALLGEGTVYRKTGWLSHAGLDMAKVRWLSRCMPEKLAQAACFLSTIEFVQHRLTGKLGIDPTNAAMRQMMNIRTLDWDADILRCLDIGLDKLPPVRPTGCFMGNLTEQAAADLGLTTATQVIQGAHDQYCGALGATALHAGDLMVSTGTAWAILATVDQPVATASFISPGPHVLPGVYGALASLPTGGAALDWVLGNASGLDYAAVDRHVPEYLDRNDGLLFYPYLNGAGHPIWQTDFKGAFLGLELHHSSEDMAVCCMESIGFHLRRMILDFEENGIPVHRLKLIGGATKSPAWVSMLAAIADRPVDVVDVKDAPCIGAAAIAGVGCGLFSDLDDALSCMVRTHEAASAPAHEREALLKKYGRFERGLEALRRLYTEDATHA